MFQLHQAKGDVAKMPIRRFHRAETKKAQDRVRYTHIKHVIVPPTDIFLQVLLTAVCEGVGGVVGVVLDLGVPGVYGLLASGRALGGPVEVLTVGIVLGAVLESSGGGKVVGPLLSKLGDLNKI